VEEQEVLQHTLSVQKLDAQSTALVQESPGCFLSVHSPLKHHDPAAHWPSPVQEFKHPELVQA
jgi:hypothetical protein